MTSKNNKDLAKIIGVIFIIISFFIGFKIYKNTNRRSFPTPRETNISLIQSWMTIDYISKTYAIPMPEFKRNLDYDFQNGKVSIEKIAIDNKIDNKTVIEKIKEIITNYKK